MPRVTDTSIFVGINCPECGKRVKLGDHDAYWVSYPELKGWHMSCWQDVYERKAQGL